MGKSHLVNTLKRAKDEIIKIKDNYDNKFIILITDGNTYDGNITNIAEEIKKETNSIIIVIFISSHNLGESKMLFNHIPKAFNNQKEIELFRASSSLDSNDDFFSNLREQKLIIPKKGEIYLFFQGNDQSTQNILFKSLKKMFVNHDILLDKLEKNTLNQYLNNSIYGFEAHNQGNEGVCYAFATATAIHLTLIKIMGKNATKFEKIKNEFIQKYEKWIYYRKIIRK